MKFEEEIMKQIVLRKNALASVSVLGQIAENEYKNYLVAEFQKLGLDPSKTYNVDGATGEITEVVPPKDDEVIITPLNQPEVILPYEGVQ